MNSGVEIQAVRNLNILKVLNHFGIDWPSGVSHIRCPILPHTLSDSTPSFKVYTETNSFYCFGCKAAGSPLEFIMAFKGMKLKEAVKFLLSTFEVKLEPQLLTKLALHNCRSSSLQKEFQALSFVMENQGNLSKFNELFELCIAL